MKKIVLCIAAYAAALAGCKAPNVQDQVVQDIVASDAGGVPAIPTDLMQDPGFESDVSGFGLMGGPDEGSATRTETATLAGGESLAVAINSYGRIGWEARFGYDDGSRAGAVRAEALIRVDQAVDPEEDLLDACLFVYLFDGGEVQEPLKQCQSLPVGQEAVRVSLPVALDGQKISRVLLFFTEHQGSSLTATIDDVHVYVDAPLDPVNPSCRGDVWSCTDWSACDPDGRQSRSCDLTDDCSDIDTPSPETERACELPLPTVPVGYRLVNLIDDPGFERGLSGFGLQGEANEGSVVRTGANPIRGAQSALVTVNSFGRVGFPDLDPGSGPDWGFDGGPMALTVDAQIQVRVESSAPAGLLLETCLFVYRFNVQDPDVDCRTTPVDPDHVVPVGVSVGFGQEQKLSRVSLRFSVENSGTVQAVIDKANLFVVQR